MAPRSFFSSRFLALVQHASLILAQACVLTVPPNPLSAAGLATPYFQTGCDQRNFAAQASFVEATILDPNTGALQQYHPLVVNQGDVAGVNFIAPTPPVLPDDAVVGLWFGTNGGSLTLQGAEAIQNGRCVNGLNVNGAVSIFGQFAYCNAPNFFAQAKQAIQNGNLKVPPPGNAKDGTPCPVTRDFRIVDMDQSDNVDATYLLLTNGMLAQNTPANNKNNTGAQVLTNGSDNALVSFILDPLVGCTPFTVPSTTAPTGMSAGLSLNEIVANTFPPAKVALVPPNDPMTVLNNNGAVTQSKTKTNLYRRGVNQPPIPGKNAQAPANTPENGTAYCQDFPEGCLYIANNMNLFMGANSPAPAVASNLYTFLSQRWAGSFGPVPALGCVNLLGNGNLVNPIQLTTNGAGVVTAATINTTACQAILNGQIKPFVANATAKAATTTAAAAAGATSSAAAKNNNNNNNQPNNFFFDFPNTFPRRSLKERAIQEREIQERGLGRPRPRLIRKKV